MKGRGKGRGRRHSGGRRSSRPGKNTRRRSPAQAPGGKARSIVGELRLHRDGYGFVVPEQGGQDIFVPARFVGDALHTDIVEVKVVGGRGAGPEGRISRIERRAVERLVGRLSRHGNTYEVVADDRRVRHRIMVPGAALGGAAKGDNVVVRITQYPRGDEPMHGEVEEVLGERGGPRTEAAAVIVRHQLSRDFRSATLDAARAAASFEVDEELGRREDLRGVPFVTIDGETAKDFDDAVAVRREGEIMKLWVSIADVSHFVRPNTALDAEAYERGTSVYFPGDCLPMLPEALSNDACSLRPGEPRLTFTAEMDIDGNGRTVASKFYRSIITSRARLTYTQVRRVLVENDRELARELGDVAEGLRLMEKCYGRLRRRRAERGSIDFDLPEPEIMIDMQGSVDDIVRSERHVGHMMIEEFMIAANEAVAEFLTDRGPGCVYRVHDAPPEEKLAEFAVMVHNLGYGSRIGTSVGPGKLAKVVSWAHGKPFERLVNHTLLRSMSQAVYSAENKGHYGLASRCYCHFTSPIRRYPDLMVHRLLAHALAGAGRKGRHGGKGSAKVHGLGEAAAHCSRRERIAMEAEREMAKMYAAKFMQSKIGEEFDGVISHCAKFGFFVELVDYFVEGLVHVTTLGGDRYDLDETGCSLVGRRKKRAFKVGDEVRISVEEVDIPAREILFELV